MGGAGRAAADMVATLDWIDRFEGVISSFVNADWQGAYKRRGVAGVLAELLATLTGHNRWRIHVSRNANLSGGDFERLLRRYGVKVWGRGFTPGAEGTLLFYVKQRQANWAEYLLVRRGVSIVGAVFNPANVQARERHPGMMPMPRAERKPRSIQRDPDVFDRVLE